MLLQPRALTECLLCSWCWGAGTEIHPAFKSHSLVKQLTSEPVGTSGLAQRKGPHTGWPQNHVEGLKGQASLLPGSYYQGEYNDNTC